MSDTFDLAQMRTELARDEGRRKYPYADTGMKLTVGVGRNLTDRGLRDDEIDYLLANDIHAAAADLDHNLPWWRTLDPVRQRVMLNLCFNMGWGTFSQFARFFSAMNQHRWDDAAVELIASKWHAQVGDRARRLESMIRTGEPA
jgi:lysozyme